MPEKILLAHGNGGQLMHDLIRGLITPRLKNPLLNKLTDSAVIDFKQKQSKSSDKKLAFTTDSFVVYPLFFRGGDIGKLAVCGTINDLVVSGAKPLYLSLALIIEEGLDYSLLERVIDSISSVSRRAGVEVIAGDIKVVPRGACDKLFINTAGIGSVVRELKKESISCGDKIIITGRIAEHGLSILNQRQGIDFGFKVKSDCASLDKLLLPLLKDEAIKFMRDPTRGGLATTLNEIAQTTNLSMVIDEEKIPVAPRIRAASELLGIDPLYIANEGNAVLIVRSDAAGRILKSLKRHRQGRFAEIIGEVTSGARGMVLLKTGLGTKRILDMLTSQPLPRIC